MNSLGFTIQNAEEIDSPALLIHLDRVEENIRRMVAIAGEPEKLRPHIKTHKIPELIQMQRNFGIAKFKCATIAEAEILGICMAPDALLAYQPVGPKVQRFLRLIEDYPRSRFSVIADDPGAIRALSAAAVQRRQTIEVLLDIDCGMHRCGIPPGDHAADLYRLLDSLPGLTPGGLHAYDGHLHQEDVTERTAACEAAFAAVQQFGQELVSMGLPVPRIVVGGTPTFPIHATRTGVECSPGTCILWDWGYATKLPDLDFLPAAMVLTRVISKPGPDRLCLDLGHKSIASENPHPRVHFPELPDARAVGHSEEHLVVETPRAPEVPVGACLYGIPWHICPTVALHQYAVTVRGGRAGARWRILAREREIHV